MDRSEFSELPDVAVLLDVKGLNCPMPLLKAKKALNEMASGELLKVLATDPGSERDFQTFSAQSGHELVEFAKDGDVFVYVLRKKS
ncbi:MAG: sulfurtransferase TusA family protein [Gammaproteobacteria bacterium]|jgi:tRNA 2-thiouridine synthesizing protein A